jgi:acyl-coenzyme A synthetase/AMP-(fatty) acid ligase
MMPSLDSHMAPAPPAPLTEASLAVTGFPLVSHHALTSPIAWRRDRTHSVQEFIRSANSLAAQLPRKRFAINICRDRYHFAVGFAAALMARQISLLPTYRATEPLQQLVRQYPGAYLLTDHEEGDLCIPRFSLNHATWEDSGPAEIPVIPAAQIAAIAFTSGSSGFPQAHAKSWGSLVMGAQALGRQFDLSQSPPRIAVGTVPAQHMYGLETTIMLPLQWGWGLHAGNSILPADIRADLEQLEAPAWLMTTPFHLKAFLSERTMLPGLEGIISATMPLDRSIAAGAERVWHVPVHEIYGCTEGGMLASRRTTAGEAWTLCHDLRMRHSQEATWVMGGHVGAWLQLADRITQRGPREFLLLGPHRDLVKVAGKRASFTALNATLNRIQGVVDGTFYRPDPGQAGSGRLRAFVVAPGMTRAAILAELRKRIDPVFLPRPLYVVDQLPRNTTGKLPQEHLKTFARHLMHPQQQAHE